MTIVTREVLDPNRTELWKAEETMMTAKLAEIWSTEPKTVASPDFHGFSLGPEYVVGRITADELFTDFPKE